MLKIIPDALLCSSNQPNPKLNWYCCLLILMYATQYIDSIKTLSSLPPALLSMERSKCCLYCKSVLRPSASICTYFGRLNVREGQSSLLIGTVFVWFWDLLVTNAARKDRGHGKTIQYSARSTLNSNQKANECQWILQVAFSAYKKYTVNM